MPGIHQATIVEGALVGSVELCYADLNSDDEDDYIAVTRSGGIGLAALTCFVYFVLSSDHGYSLWEIVTKDFNSHDFIDLNSDGSCQFVQTTFLYGEPGRDRKVHNYWTHSLLVFNGGAIKYDNRLDRRFPKWVWSHSSQTNRRQTSWRMSRRRGYSRCQSLSLYGHWYWLTSSLS